jgi:hypothetical protein
VDQVNKFAMLLIFCQLAWAPGHPAFAEDYPECRVRCEAEYAACTNEPTAADPEVSNAQIASCDPSLQSCYAQCETLRPVPQGVEENNPNIIRK